MLGLLEVNIINVLLDSLKLLYRRPQLFVPKLSSALISSLWIIAVFTMLEARQFQRLFTFYGLTGPLIIVIGVFVPLMTAEMIRNRDREKLLKFAFLKTFGNWKKVIGVAFLMLMISFTAVLPATLGLSYYVVTENVLAGAIGVSLSLIILIVLSFLIYFLPISVLDEETVISGIESSVKTSMENRREVSALIVFSLGLFLLAFASEGLTRNLGFAAFVVGRLLSATVTTYTFVVSPNYYLMEKKGDRSEDSEKESEESESSEELEEG